MLGHLFLTVLTMKYDEPYLTRVTIGSRVRSAADNI